MEVCPSIVLNSDASENVAYNNPDFPAYIKKGQLSRYPDFRAVSHWHDDLEFILILEGQMFYDVNGQKISLQAEISRLRMVATSFSSFGICPMLAHSSIKQRT